MSKARKKPKTGRSRKSAEAAKSEAIVTLSVGAGDPLQSAGLFDHLAVMMKAAKARTPRSARARGAKAGKKRPSSR